jgi:hypothetical protein
VVKSSGFYKEGRLRDRPRQVKSVQEIAEGWGALKSHLDIEADPQITGESQRIVVAVAE